MTSGRAHVKGLLAGALVAAVLLSGCGSGGPSDKDRITAIIKQEGTSPRMLCNHLTVALLATLGGKRGCLRQASSAAADPSTHATSVKVRGKSATAVVVNRDGSHPIRLVKQRGVWKIAGVT